MVAQRKLAPFPIEDPSEPTPEQGEAFLRAVQDGDGTYDDPASPWYGRQGKEPPTLEEIEESEEETRFLMEEYDREALDERDAMRAEMERESLEDEAERRHEELLERSYPDETDRIDSGPPFRDDDKEEDDDSYPDESEEGSL
jgi:hypothetical protein